MSLTKNNNPGFSWNDTQASTVAALGNAALLLGGNLQGGNQEKAEFINQNLTLTFSGALIFNSINNRANSRTNHRLYGLPPPRPLPLRKRRLRKGNKNLRKRRLRQRRPFIGGRRRLRKNMEVRRPGAAFFHRPQYNLENYLGNHRIQDDYIQPQTRDHLQIQLRGELDRNLLYLTDHMVLFQRKT